MANIALTKSKHLLPFASVMHQSGAGVHRLLKKARLPPGCIEDGETLIPAVCLAEFRELVAQEIGGPNLALEIIDQIEPQIGGSLGQKCAQAPTLSGVLSMFRDLIISETSNVIITLRPLPNGDLWFGQRVLSVDESSGWQTKLYVIIWMLKFTRLVDAAWSPSEISLNATATRERFEAIEVLGSTARFREKETGFLVPASRLALPVPKHPGKGEVMNLDSPSITPAGTYAESVKQIIRSYAANEWLSVEQFSEVTSTSMRTIQRRLMVEQESYSDLVQQCRAEIAGELLESTDAPIAEIANRLGYCNQGNFTRAFYRWVKVSPSEFRKQRTLTH